MRNLIGLALLIFLMFSAGCFWRSKESAETEALAGLTLTGTNAPSADDKLIVTAADGLKGKVSAANANLRFVVLTFPIGQMAAINQRLYVYRNGLKVGELNVTGPQRDDSIVADIAAGEAQVGDEARDR
jgi:hypothetical protein